MVTEQFKLRVRIYLCHSERSEESLLGLNLGMERILGTQRASERQNSFQSN
jgi:hypothetical protein